MGQEGLSIRAVCDTNVVISALVFASGRLRWLRHAWATGSVVPLVDEATVVEIIRVLQYPKFRLSSEEQLQLLEDYLPFAETVPPRNSSAINAPQCRDPDDQKFIDLALSANADCLITGDPDLLELAGPCEFQILKPAEAARLVRP